METTENGNGKSRNKETLKISSNLLPANLNNEPSIGELITLPDLLILSC